MNEDNLIAVVPDYLYDVNGLDSDDQVDLSSDSSEESAEYSGEYETVLSDIASGVVVLQSSTSNVYDETHALLMEEQLLNDNINILNDNLISCFHLMLVFLIILVIKMLFSIFNKYLCLGQA